MPPKAGVGGRGRDAEGMQAMRRAKHDKRDALALVAPHPKVKVPDAILGGLKEAPSLDVLPRMVPFIGQVLAKLPTLEGAQPADSIAKTFLGKEGSFCRASQQVLAQWHNTNRSKLAPTWRRLACCGWLLQRCLKTAIIEAAYRAHGRLELLQHTEATMYDETPLKINMPDSSTRGARGGARAVRGQMDQERRLRECVVPLQSLPSRGEAITTRLFQIRTAWGILLKKHEEGADVYFCFVGQMPNHLQLASTSQ